MVATPASGPSCPGCSSPLVQERHHGLQLDVCDRCQGLWFDPDELGQYWSRAHPDGGPPPVQPANFEVDDECTALDCPRCRTRTVQTHRVDVFIGGPCTRCSGVWLGPTHVARVPNPRPAHSGKRGWLSYTAFDTLLEVVGYWLQGQKPR